MPRVMERSDWMQAVANVGTADGVWSENEKVIAHPGNSSVFFPEEGEYQVILVKIGAAKPKQNVRPARRRTAVKPKDIEITPIVRSLIGKLKYDGKSYKDEIADILIEKYEALG